MPNKKRDKLTIRQADIYFDYQTNNKQTDRLIGRKKVVCRITKTTFRVKTGTVKYVPKTEPFILCLKKFMYKYVNDGQTRTYRSFASKYLVT